MAGITGTSICFYRVSYPSSLPVLSSVLFTRKQLGNTVNECNNFAAGRLYKKDEGASRTV